MKKIFHFARAVFSVIYFRYPARKMKVIGVTGTDGKTTTSTLIYHILLAAKKKVALISTVAAYAGDQEIDTGLHVTTPNSWRLQKIMRSFVDDGFEYLVLEVTSHGLDQHRVLGTNISIGVLTNITHEHLDYHKTYRQYVRAKAKMFDNAEIAILNKNDESYPHIKKLINPGVKKVLYDSKTVKGSIRKIIFQKFKEKYNQQNATAAILTARSLKIDETNIIKGIRKFPGISGRMEKIKNKKGIKVFIDFAHTPNALENVLKTLIKEKNKNSKLIVVFGCAGERDIGKRPLMGKISAQLADISVFTAEDPRREDLNHILEEMVGGAKKTTAKEINQESEIPSKGRAYIKIPDRRSAIKYAIQTARKGDIVVMCGKGHEKSLAFGKIEMPWSDQEVTKKILSTDGR